MSRGWERETPLVVEFDLPFSIGGAAAVLRDRGFNTSGAASEVRVPFANVRFSAIDIPWVSLPRESSELAGDFLACDLVITGIAVE